MKKFITFVLLLAGLSACDDGRSQLQQQQQIHQTEVERQARIESQKREHDAEASSHLWQSIAFFLGIASVVLLGVGACLGSSGRKHVK